jgi:hypothetical protein
MVLDTLKWKIIKVASHCSKTYGIAKDFYYAEQLINKSVSKASSSSSLGE